MFKFREWKFEANAFFRALKILCRQSFERVLQFYAAQAREK